MLKHRLFTEQFVLVTIIAILHYLALKFYLYWSIWWFDIPVHFLGGLWVGFIAMWFLFLSGIVYKNVEFTKTTKIFLIIVASVIAVGILWEVFEVYSGVLTFEKNYWSDTSLDLVMDTIGGIVAFIYSRKYLRNF